MHSELSLTLLPVIFGKAQQHGCLITFWVTNLIQFWYFFEDNKYTLNFLRCLNFLFFQQLVTEIYAANCSINRIYIVVSRTWKVFEKRKEKRRARRNEKACHSQTSTI